MARSILMNGTIFLIIFHVLNPETQQKIMLSLFRIKDNPQFITLYSKKRELGSSEIMSKFT